MLFRSHRLLLGSRLSLMRTITIRSTITSGKIPSLLHSTIRLGWPRLYDTVWRRTWWKTSRGKVLLFPKRIPSFQQKCAVVLEQLQTLKFGLVAFFLWIRDLINFVMKGRNSSASFYLACCFGATTPKLANKILSVVITKY